MSTTVALTKALAAQERRAQQAERVASTLAAVGASPDLDAALTALVRGAVELCGGQQGGVRIYQEQDPARRCGDLGDRGFWVHQDGTLTPAAYKSPPRGSVSEALKYGGPPRLIYDLLALDEGIPLELAEQRRRRGMRASIAVPLAVGQERIGSLHIDHPEAGAFGPGELALAEALARQAGGAIERIRATEALRESEERYRALVELSPELVAILRDGVVAYVNSAGVAFAGAASPSDLIGRPVLDFVHPEDAPRVRARLRRAIHNRLGSPPLVERLIRLDGQVVFLEVATAPVVYRGSPAAQVIGRDVAERARLERIRAERARMDGALLVARTVAHEVNNALTPVAGFAELLSLRPEISRDATLAACVKMIGDAAEDAAQLVRRLQRIVRLEETAESPLGPHLPVLDLDRSTAP